MQLNLKSIGTVIVIILVFTLLDYLGHQYLEKNNNLEIVNTQYYYNKILYGSFVLLLVLFFVDKIFPHLAEYSRISVITLSTVLLLQFRYYGIYSKRFNIIVVILHYIALGIPVYIAQEKRYI